MRKLLTRHLQREDEAAGYLADSVSFRASGPPFLTYVGQAPDALVQPSSPHAAIATVVVERRIGWACFAEVKEEPSVGPSGLRLAGDT